jgi:hypothetical protein
MDLIPILIPCVPVVLRMYYGAFLFGKMPLMDTVFRVVYSCRCYDNFARS